MSRSELPCVVDEEGVASFAEVATRARALALDLCRLGLGGARVALLAAPGRQWVEGFWGVLLAGAAVVPLSPLHPEAERAALYTQSKSRALLITPELAASARELDRQQVFLDGRLLTPGVSERRHPAQASGEAPCASGQSEALLLFTSGTTGRPKGVPATHENVYSGVSALVEAWGMTARDRLIHALPLHHLHGICVAFLSTFCAGGCTHFLARHSASGVLDALPAASVLMGVPTQYHRLVEHLEALPEPERARYCAELAGLRLITSGSSKLPEQLGRAIQALSGQYPLERYGMTEVGIVLSNPLAGPRKPGSPGKPLPGCEIRIVDEAGRDLEPGRPGEIWIRGPSVFSGYDADPDSTRAAFAEGFFKSGDTAEWTADGYVRILGRTSVDIIKSGGYKLSAIEIEEKLRHHPWVGDVAVVGMPDAVWGERAVAVIVPSVRGNSEIGQDADAAGEKLKAWLKQSLAGYQVPKAYVWWDQLPRNAMGKIQKAAILTILEQGF